MRLLSPALGESRQVCLCACVLGRRTKWMSLSAGEGILASKQSLWHLTQVYRGTERKGECVLNK